jgi:hypothetical protein
MTTETNLLDARSFEPKHAENEPDAKAILPEPGGVKEGSFCRYKNYGRKGDQKMRSTSFHPKCARGTRQPERRDGEKQDKLRID